ncbi:MAG: methyltransferase domain-containing protein [Methanobacteriota archaeon]|nr:MAG: methyltransferase domain-containing protein [Euryarchaeota archaeon]
MTGELEPYIHGRSKRESERLSYQAGRLADILHHGTRYPPGSRVLEAACGVGAQTAILAVGSPEAEFVSIDLSSDSLSVAKERIDTAGLSNVTFQQADIYNLPFESESFDHVFICFLLEHLADPLRALKGARDVLRPGGTVTVIEGDHGSAFFYPDSKDARQVIGGLVDLQKEMGGNALIGRELWHLVNDAGFSSVNVSPRCVYADAGHPDAVEGVRKIFIAMVEGVGAEAVHRGLVDREAWNAGIRDLHRTTEAGGTFSYTFFKAVGIR